MEEQKRLNLLNPRKKVIKTKYLRDCLYRQWTMKLQCELRKNDVFPS